MRWKTWRHLVIIKKLLSAETNLCVSFFQKWHIPTAQYSIASIRNSRFHILRCANKWILFAFIFAAHPVWHLDSIACKSSVFRIEWVVVIWLKLKTNSVHLDWMKSRIVTIITFRILTETHVQFILFIYSVQLLWASDIAWICCLNAFCWLNHTLPICTFLVATTDRRWNCILIAFAQFAYLIYHCIWSETRCRQRHHNHNNYIYRMVE